MLSWEFPPRIIGGISPHVYYLSRSLVKQGVRTIVVTCDFPDAPDYELVDGVEVYRIDSYKNPAPDFHSWIYLMNLNMQKDPNEVESVLDKYKSEGFTENFVDPNGNKWYYLNAKGIIKVCSLFT